jgi:hypothetical protein
MSENPYQSPATDARVVGVISGRREDLRSVAKYQKGILLCILAYLVLVGLSFVVPPEVRPMLALAIIPVGITGTVFVFLLAIKVYSPVAGAALGILTLLPCIGIVVLLIINAKATDILKKNGIRVGLLGASLSDIAEPGTQGASQG